MSKNHREMFFYLHKSEDLHLQKRRDNASQSHIRLRTTPIFHQPINLALIRAWEVRPGKDSPVKPRLTTIPAKNLKGITCSFTTLSRPEFLRHLAKYIVWINKVNTFYGNLWIIIFQKWNPGGPVYRTYTRTAFRIYHKSHPAKNCQAKRNKPQ